ncbi:hypothetical protein ACP70R_005366 [Stipagrostis hirtigluma subsp. patula]
METRPRRRPGSPLPRGPRRRRRSSIGNGDGVDRISGIPDDLLLQVLVRLRCVRSAARAGVLSRRWRGLWRRLPELYFRGVRPAALEAALAQVALPKLSLLDIDVFDRPGFSAAGFAALLRTAARLDPVVLRLCVAVDRNNRDTAIKMPCFGRATTIRLAVIDGDLHLTPVTEGGGFPVLESLCVLGCHLDAGSVISRSPRLRVLELRHSQDSSTIMVHSTTIEKLVVSSPMVLGGIDIDAPMLKKFSLHATMRGDFSMSLLAPMVVNHSWDCTFRRYPAAVGIHGMWCLYHLELLTKESSRILSLHILRPVVSLPHPRNLQEMFQFPNFSALELHLKTRGHVYGPIVLNLLRTCNAIQKLKLLIDHCARSGEACQPNCDCEQPQNWRSQNISLMGLEEVEIDNLKGSGHEVDFLKLLFRCAPLTKVIVNLTYKEERVSKGCKEIYNVFKEIEWHQPQML